MDTYRKHWAKPLHAFKVGQSVKVSDSLTQPDTPGVVTQADPFAAWVFVRLLDGPHVGHAPLSFHHSSLVTES